MEGIQTVPGGGKDPWTEGAVSLGVINITDLCNLTHFRSPSATTTTRSIFLPFLLLKPVHPSHPLPLPSFVLPSSPRSSTSRPPKSVLSSYLSSSLCPLRVQATKIHLPKGWWTRASLYISLSMGRRIFITTRLGRSVTRFSIFNPRNSFFCVVCEARRCS